jgi:ABC-type amino acid transport substrate-binding protein
MPAAFKQLRFIQRGNMGQHPLRTWRPGFGLAFAMLVLLLTRAQAGTLPLLMSEELDERNHMIPIKPEIVRFVQYIGKASGLELEVRRYPWKRAVSNAAEGEGLIFGISKTAERLRHFKFSDPVFSDSAWLITPCDATFTYNRITDLKGKTIGIVRGTSYGEEFDTESQTLFKLEYDTNSNPARLKKLAAKRMDAIVVYSTSLDPPQIESLLAAEAMSSVPTPGTVSARDFCILPHPVSVLSIHFAIRPDMDHGRIARINKALAEGRKSGELERFFNARGKDER